MNDKLKNQPVNWGLPSIWIITFFFTSTMALLVQLVFLPYWFPLLHAGNGLLIGGDWVGFDQIATQLAESIARDGWSAWELRPERQSPAGIAAVFYFLFGAHPWTLVPMNAAVHATTTVVMVRIMQTFVSDIRIALLCALPFILFPSSLILYSQIHKDGIFFLGIILNLYGWVLLARLNNWDGVGIKTFLPVLYIFVGCFLIWVMRPYGIKMMQGIGCIFIIMLAPYFVTQILRRRLLFSRGFLALLIIAGLPIAIGIFKDGSERGEVTLVHTIAQDDRTTKITAERDTNQAFLNKAEQALERIRWMETQWVPRFLDDIFLTISIVRSGYQGSIGSSNIDADIYFRSASEFLLYLPRAIQIGFTAPFPSDWIAKSVSENKTTLKKLIAIEMFFIYCALFFLAYAFWYWGKKIHAWIIFVFCTAFILLYTYITPNIGSLHRTRYGFIMILLAFAIAGGLTFWRSRLSQALPVTPKNEY